MLKAVCPPPPSPHTGVKVPSSLQNIFKELNADVGCSRPNHGSLVQVGGARSA